jgi:hypothetical protein
VKIETRIIDGARWVRLDDGLAVVPIGLMDGAEGKKGWRERIATAVKNGEAVVNVGLD